MLKTKRFYIMFGIFALTASIGLMMIGNITNITYEQGGPEMAIAWAAFLISFVAVVNTGGRIAGGALSDKIGRVNTLLIATVLQMINMALFVTYTNVITLAIGFALVGICFGVFLTMFPALTADQFGLKNYGANYGIMYLAYGAAGVVAPVIADRVELSMTYLICAGLMIVAVGLIFWLRSELKTPLSSSTKIAGQASSKQ
jgi:MFS family permease